MTKEAKQEIRRALLGRTVPGDDGRLVVLEKGQRRLSQGIADGAGAVRFLGVRRKAKRIAVSCSENKARGIAYKIAGDVGRILYLSEQPEAAACIIRYILTRPAVLVFGYEDGVPILSAWSGRGLTGWISNRRALQAFLDRMPAKYMTLSDEAAPADQEEKQRKEEKRARKAAKKEKKRARKEKKNGAKPEAEAETDPQTEFNTEE